jgi:hypothetical protein
VTKRIERIDAKTVLASDEGGAGELRDELAASIDEPAAKEKAQQVLALHPLVKAQLPR